MRTVETNVRNRLNVMSPTGNGFFRLEIDEAPNHNHAISWNTILNTIIAELNHGRRIMGATTTSNAFARATNGKLWRRSSAGWADTSIPMTGVPAVLEGINHTFDVIYRTPGNGMSHTFLTAANWTSRSLGGATVTDPVVTHWSGIIHIVGMGGTDRRPYYWRIAADNTASPFALVSSAVQFVGQPALVAAADGLHLYGVGLDRQIYHLKSNSPTSPTSWTVEALGGEVAGFPTTIRDGAIDRVYVRDLGTDHLWEASRTGGVWSWEDLSVASNSTTLLSGSPSVSLSGSDIVVYARAASGNLQRFRKTNGSWGPVQSTATNLSDSPQTIGGQAYIRGTSGKLWRWSGAAFTDLGGQVY